MRIPTRVHLVGPIRPACSAGSQLSRTGETGALTLLFRNRLDPAAGQYLGFTCAHVVGDLLRSRPVSPWVWSSCCPAVVPLGETAVTTSLRGHELDYDIALIRLNERAPRGCQLRDRTTRHGVPLKSFLRSEDIRIGTQLRCDFPASNVAAATVSLPRGTVFMDVGGRRCAVKNAFTLRARVLPGDSGGLLYTGDRAAGILFGRSPDGLGWFHALGDAVRHLASLGATPAFEVFA
jgi:hypothetical protein